jgi:hypothetical protein
VPAPPLPRETPPVLFPQACPPVPLPHPWQYCASPDLGTIWRGDGHGV